MHVELENQSSVDLEIGKVAGVNFDIGKNKNSTSYKPLTDKPSINGVELVGNKTTEDLGIKAGTDIELITEIKPESIEEDLEDNQVYNGNAIHDLARLFGMTLEPIKAKTIFDVSCTISLATMTVSNVSNYSKEIIEKRNEGNLVRMNCSFVENPKLNVVVILNVIDGDWTFFYPVIRGNIGEGMKTYVFRLGVGTSNATIEAYDLSGSDINLKTEFDLYAEYEENDVYNAIAVNQLMEIFGFEIMQIMEFIENHEERISALEG